jgi:hypothetical protein
LSMLCGGFGRWDWSFGLVDGWETGRPDCLEGCLEHVPWGQDYCLGLFGRSWPSPAKRVMFDL